jgi:ABC-type transport system involved in multi-copper enzyme maturation permease subunit
MSGTPTSALNDALRIARFDLRESIRTRRALVLALLYALVSAISSYIYIKIVGLSDAAESFAGALVVDGRADQAAQAQAGAVVELAQNTAYQSLLKLLAGGDPAIAAHLGTYPAMVLIFVWFSLTFLPWLIALTSYDFIAGDLHHRTIRFLLLRTTRGAYVLGKLLSQVLLIIVIAGLSMLPVLLLGLALVRDFDLPGTAAALLATWPILVFFALGVLGPIALASQLVRTPAAARALALLLLIALWALSLAALAGQPFELLDHLTPFHYKVGFFRPDLADRLLTALACVALAAGYTALGFLRFRRRDL